MEIKSATAKDIMRKVASYGSWVESLGEHAAHGRTAPKTEEKCNALYTEIEQMVEELERRCQSQK